jgi:murein L,D-transpeptidase YcbB/YkuD
MKNFILSISALLFSFSLATANRYKKENPTEIKILCTQAPWTTTTKKAIVPLDSDTIRLFFKKYPKLKKYYSDVMALYKNRNYNSIWFDDKGLIEFANLLFSKVGLLENEGLKLNLPYIDKIDAIFSSETANMPPSDKELLLSSMYIYYAKKVFHGIDSAKIHETGWFLPTKNISYTDLLDSIVNTPQLLNKNEKQLFGQYYKLREALGKYRQIEKTGDWTPITSDSLIREYQPGDSSKTLAQIRHRLLVLGDLKQDSKSPHYDAELVAGVLNYKKRNGYGPDPIITNNNIMLLNTPIEKYIKTIIVNMERCRWIAPELTKAYQYIVINIPSYKLIFKRDGKKELESKVIIGKGLTETVIFSGNMTQIIFSPYWNVPTSILENELKIQIAKDTTYIASHNMEWHKGYLRQKPGVKNPMGLVKFNFPNSNNIFLHDTPFKNLFDLDYRAFSHGCINVSKAKELAVLILKDDPYWPLERINDAMKGVQETTYVLEDKIPIHIGYFTAWVNDADEINFYFDIYQKDDRLAELLFHDEAG